MSSAWVESGGHVPAEESSWWPALRQMNSGWVLQAGTRTACIAVAQGGFNAPKWARCGQPEAQARGYSTIFEELEEQDVDTENQYYNSKVHAERVPEEHRCCWLRSCLRHACCRDGNPVLSVCLLLCPRGGEPMWI